MTIQPAVSQTASLSLAPIGVIRRSEQGIFIEIEAQFRPALTGLEHFSHVIVLWWAHLLDGPECRTTLEMYPPYAPDHLTGVFASRSPVRPNPVLLTTCKLLSLDQAQGRLQVQNLDAFDGAPVIDLKAYFPVCDRVQAAHIPEWLAGWPEWMPEDGLGLMPGEE